MTARKRKVVPEPTPLKPGDLVRDQAGKWWRVHCEFNGTIGCVPVSRFTRLKWKFTGIK